MSTSDYVSLLSRLSVPYIAAILVLWFLNKPMQILLTACLRPNITLVKRLQIALAGMICMTAVPLAFWFLVHVAPR